jgi:PAS domain S-box-containing protein
MALFFDDNAIGDLGYALKLLKESRAGFLQLFNNSPVCMSMTTTNLGKRTYIKVNKKFLEKFGFDETEIIGRTSVEIGILDAAESVKVGEIIKEKGRLQNDYVKCRTKAGEIVHTISSIEMMDMNNEIYLVSFFIDITKIIDQQAIIEQHVQQLEEANRELEAFSYSVSHDLRAPLRAINAYSNILEEDFHALLDEEGKRMLTAIKLNALKMGNLIDDLLEFAKLGNESLRKTSIDMNSLVHEVWFDLEKAMSHKAVIKTGKLDSIIADYPLLKQVLVNLISNAIKYSSKKENPIIVIGSQIENDHVIYTVQDNGEGFDMKYAGKLFGVFQRLHTNEQFEGTGVGLAIVHRIISKHGGTISAEGQVGKGATFSFTLPSC